MTTRLARSAVALLMAVAVGGAAAASTAPQSGEADEIVVTARRTGAPVWQVVSDTTTLVIIGSIERVTNETRWNREALAETLKGADRVMYPATVAVTASPFQAFGWLAKWRRQATLPKGTELSGMLSADRLARLQALQARGLVEPGFERRHPLHLARDLEEEVAAKVAIAPDVVRQVDKVVRDNRLKTVPLTRLKGKPLADDLFDSPPERHLPCLEAAIDLAEAGPGAITQRATDWANRRVLEAVASPVTAVEAACWPAGAPGGPKRSDIVRTLKEVLADRPVTVAVLPLRSLANGDGIIEQLADAGFEVSGPRWK